MNKDEVLKLAMEAMEITGGFDVEINAIKEALAQPEPWEKFCDSNCVWTDHHPDCKLAQPEYQSTADKSKLEKVPAKGTLLAQPEQEPVAWRNAAIRLGEDLCSVGPFGYYDMTAEQWLDWALSVVTVHAPPPQRKPLTENEIKHLWYEACQTNLELTSQLIVHLARNIEAAHGIKGEA